MNMLIDECGGMRQRRNPVTLKFFIWIIRMMIEDNVGLREMTGAQSGLVNFEMFIKYPEGNNWDADGYMSSWVRAFQCW